MDDIDHKLWVAAVHNWQVRCGDNAIRPPFEWALQFEYDGFSKLILLNDNYEHFHRFLLARDLLHDLLLGNRSWKDVLHTEAIEMYHDGPFSQELYDALAFFHI